MRQFSHFAVALMFFGAAVGNAFADSATSYTTTVHLRDGKQVLCAVNEPAFAQQGTMQTLTRRDRNEAEVIATAERVNEFATPGCLHSMSKRQVLCWVEVPSVWVG